MSLRDAGVLVFRGGRLKWRGYMIVQGRRASPLSAQKAGPTKAEHLGDKIGSGQKAPLKRV